MEEIHFSFSSSWEEDKPIQKNCLTLLICLSALSCRAEVFASFGKCNFQSAKLYFLICLKLYFKIDFNFVLFDAMLVVVNLFQFCCLLTLVVGWSVADEPPHHIQLPATLKVVYTATTASSPCVYIIRRSYSTTKVEGSLKKRPSNFCSTYLQKYMVCSLSRQ